MTENYLKDFLNDLNVIQKQIEDHNNDKFLTGLVAGKEENSKREDISRMIATISSHIKFVINDDKLSKDEAITFINQACDIHLKIANLIKKKL